MTPAWGFLILATLMVVGGVALSWAGAVRRKRSYEEFILRKAKRAGGWTVNYQNVVSAVVRALAAETINSAGGCDFEPKVQAAKQKGAIVGKEAAFLFDCMVFSRLHKTSPRSTGGTWWRSIRRTSTGSMQRSRKSLVLIARRRQSVSATARS